MNYYEILQVLPTALPEVIHMAYKALAKKYHPDIYTGDKKYAEEKMKLITAAYRVLSDPQQRMQYDNTYFSQNNSGYDNNSKSNAGKSRTDDNGKKSEQKNQQREASLIERVLRLFALMFNGFVEHKQIATAHMSELEKLTASDADFQYVFGEMRKNFKDFESDFLLPGAMLIVLDKYKSYSTFNEYRELCECYSSYMNYIYNVSFPLEPYASDYRKTLDKDYYSFYYQVFRTGDGFQGRTIVKDYDAYRAAFESAQDAMRSFMHDETEEEKKIREQEQEAERRRSERPLRYVECWCDPFSFYPSGFADKYEIIKVKSEPLKISDRYAFFARRLFLEKNTGFRLVCYCLEKANEKDADFSEKEKVLIHLVSERCATTDNFELAWSILREALPEVTYLNKSYVEFAERRICDNLEKIKNNVIKHINSSRSQVSYEYIKRLEEIKSDKYSGIDYYFECIGRQINFCPEFMRGQLQAELDKQKAAADRKFNETVSYLRERITEYNALKFWIPENRCRHCGGAFKGVIKKSCARCGKEKDYK